MSSNKERGRGRGGRGKNSDRGNTSAQGRVDASALLGGAMGTSPFMPNPFSMMPPTMAPMGAMAPTMMDPMAMMSCGMGIPGITHKGGDKAPPG